MDQEIFTKVQETLTGALGIEKDEIHFDSSLTKDLGAESIDFIDIIFRLEKTFDIKIPSGDLFPAHILNDEKYIKSGMVTPEGLKLLNEKYSYLDLEEFSRNPEVSKLADQFSVKMIVRYIEERMAKKAEH
jgi:acyl carrier protein